MTKLTFKEDNGLSIELPNPSVMLIPEGKGFTLRMESIGNNVVTAGLSAVTLQSLVLQAVAQSPSLFPSFTVRGGEEVYRIPARPIKHLDDRGVHLLLREINTETLIIFLWYMKDAELIKQIRRSLSRYAREAIMEDLNNWRGINPDTVDEFVAIRGRNSVTTVMAILSRLIDEQQIENVIGGAP